ncbi:MAG: 4-hydroxy-3-methylbut-2-enyl diphosphate reductase [Bacteroidales bacterium]|nr:4-hydroxy-3-methylbut-2-enyl diphosphate reductase [Bacteroidales bacterium]
MKQVTKVEIDPSSGFCFGVEKAIETAEKYLDEGGEVFGLGSMVHNNDEIFRLEKRGLRTISTGDFNRIGPGKVILRAHGEPPDTYRLAKESGIHIIDATCPIVARLQKKIRKKYLELDQDNEQIVLFGKEGHPETIGLLGQTDGKAVLVTHPEDLDPVDPGKFVFLYSQTTMDPDRFRRLEENLATITSIAGSQRLKSDCTICNQMKRRKPDLKRFALKQDVVIFVSGKHSSNGKMLYEYSKKHNANTHWIQSAKEIDASWLKGKKRVGISGATSTPGWQLEEVKKSIQSLITD